MEKFPEGIAELVLKLDLLQDARFLVVVAVSAANPHADFRGSVTAEDGAVLDNGGLGAVARGSDSGAHPGHAASNHANIEFMVLTVKMGFHKGNGGNYHITVSGATVQEENDGIGGSFWQCQMVS